MKIVFFYLISVVHIWMLCVNTTCITRFSLISMASSQLSSIFSNTDGSHMTSMRIAAISFQKWAWNISQFWKVFKFCWEIWYRCCIILVKFNGWIQDIKFTGFMNFQNVRVIFWLVWSIFACSTCHMTNFSEGIYCLKVLPNGLPITFVLILLTLISICYFSRSEFFKCCALCTWLYSPTVKTLT